MGWQQQYEGVAAGPANMPSTARETKITPYTIEILNGLGVGIDATTASQTVALVGKGNALVLDNSDGTTSAYFAWDDDDSIAATTSHYRVGAGVKEVVTIDIATTHVASRMSTGTARVMIHRGYGV